MKYFNVLLFVFALLSIESCHSLENSKLDDGLYAKIITDKGNILIKLEFEKVPITVANFVSLAEGNNKNVKESLRGRPYYDGLTFHRVVPNFVIQGGDPDGNGSGGPGYKFQDEFPKDDEGKLLFTHYKAGTLSMANAGPGTNGSQFFITHKETPHLDGKHSVFGYVVEGLEVVNAIAQGDVIKKIEILRIGKKAKSFEAAKLIDETLKADEERLVKEAEVQKKALEDLPKTMEAKANFFKEAKLKAKTLASGLKLYVTEEGTGEKPESTAQVLVNYAGYFTDGNLFDTNWADIAKTYGKYNANRAQQNGYRPFPAPYNNEARLIPGFREGLLQMNYGDKALLFIPSHLGYGETGAGNVIPPNTDLVFEIQIVNQKL